MRVYTDHQLPLTFAISDKNPNTKLKRWNGIIEDYGAKLIYTPGKEKLVADALSRQNVNALEDTYESDALYLAKEKGFVKTHTSQTPLQ